MPDLSLASTTNTEAEIRAAMGVAEPAPTPPAPVPVAPLTPPAAPIAPDEPETPDTDEPEVPDAAATPAPAPKPKKDSIRGLQDRIGGLTREKYDTIRERDDARAQIADLQRRLAALQTTPPPSSPTTPEPVKIDVGPKPKEEDFKTFGEYLEARDVYNEKAILARVEAERKVSDAARAAKDQADAAARDHQQRESTFQTRFNAARAKIENFDAIIQAGANLPVGPMMTEAIKDSEVGPEIMVYLAQNPQEAERIAALGPGPQIKAIGRIEERIASKASAPEPKQTPAPAPVVAKPVSKAPAPPATVGGSPTKSTVDLNEADFATYKAVREAEILARGRRR